MYFNTIESGSYSGLFPVGIIGPNLASIKGIFNPLKVMPDGLY